jgi:hypothetical protein
MALRPVAWRVLVVHLGEDDGGADACGVDLLVDGDAAAAGHCAIAGAPAELAHPDTGAKVREQ